MLQIMKNVCKKIAVNQQRRADYYLLMNLTDKELRDMGITRGEIRAKVYQ